MLIVALFKSFYQDKDISVAPGFPKYCDRCTEEERKQRMAEIERVNAGWPEVKGAVEKLVKTAGALAGEK